MTIAYQVEDSRYPRLSQMEVKPDHAKRIVMKLSRHFKLEINSVTFRNLRSHGGFARKFWNQITLTYNPNCLLIVHEVNHFLIWKKYPNRKVNHGSKKWFSSLNRIIIYCLKNDWWKDEFERIDMQRHETVMKQEEREDYRKTDRYKYDMLLKSIRKWESKRKRAENALKRINRRRKFLEKKLQIQKV